MSDSRILSPAAAGGRHLFGPALDFLCLGGGALLVQGGLMALALVLDPGRQPTGSQLALTALLAANVVNHPHFAHSYQIFYDGFGRRLGSTELPAWLRRRYAFAGIVVPLLLATYFVLAMRRPDGAMLGFALDVMGFVVGWHYVKQGFGMAMVDAALKRRPFAPSTRRLMLWNAYACWLLGWVEASRGGATRELWGISGTVIGFGPTFAAVAWGAAGVTTIALIFSLLADRLRSGRSVALNGLIAYAVTLYAWVVFAKISPLFFYFIPLFHSLQYLAVVWRFQLNRVGASQANGRHAGEAPRLRFAAFVVVGVVLGLFGFWLLPMTLDSAIPLDAAVFGPNPFLFVFWVFINVHHYFMDNVMWRRDNPDAKAYLFS